MDQTIGLEPEILSRIFAAAWDSKLNEVHKRFRDYPDNGVTARWKALSAAVKQVVRISNVCTSWADIVLDRRFWLSLGVKNVTMLRTCLPPIHKLSPRWDAFFDDAFGFDVFLDLSEELEETYDILDVVERAMFRNRTNFIVVSGTPEFDLGLDLVRFWRSAVPSLQADCSRLCFEYETLHSLVTLNDISPPTTVPNATGSYVSFRELVHEGTWLKLKELCLVKFAGGYLDFTSEEVQDRIETKIAKIVRTNTVIFPSLKYLALYDVPTNLDLDLVLKVAPNVTHFYFQTSDRHPFDVCTLNPFMRRDLGYRLFIHPIFMHVHAWPGPKSGLELQKCWTWQMRMRVVRADLPIMDRTASEEVLIVERRGGRTYSTSVAVQPLFRCVDLHTISVTDELTG